MKYITKLISGPFPSRGYPLVPALVSRAPLLAIFQKGTSSRVYQYNIKDLLVRNVVLWMQVILTVLTSTAWPGLPGAIVLVMLI